MKKMGDEVIERHRETGREKGEKGDSPNEADNVKHQMQMIGINIFYVGKGRNHVRRADDHLDVVADHEDVGHALEALLLNGVLDALGRVAAVEEGAALGEEEGPDGEAEGYHGLADEADDDLK